MYREDIELKNIFFSELSHLKDTWSCYADLPDRQVYTKTEQGLNHMSVFYRFKVPTNMFFPLALLSEVDLFKEWIPSVLKSEILENKSDFRKIVHVQRQFPFPLSNRELIICASAMLVKERRGAMVMLRSMNDERKQIWDP